MFKCSVTHQILLVHSLQSSPWSHWKLEDQLRGTTSTNLPAATVLPWTWSTSPRYYREVGPHPRGVTVNSSCPHYRGVTAVTAGKPWSPSPCISLLDRPLYLRHKLYDRTLKSQNYYSNILRFPVFTVSAETTWFERLFHVGRLFHMGITGYPISKIKFP